MYGYKVFAIELISDMCERSFCPDKLALWEELRTELCKAHNITYEAPIILPQGRIVEISAYIQQAGDGVVDIPSMDSNCILWFDNNGELIMARLL